jgi:hypothetical protein
MYIIDGYSLKFQCISIFLSSVGKLWKLKYFPHSLIKLKIFCVIERVTTNVL